MSTKWYQSNLLRVLFLALCFAAIGVALAYYQYTTSAGASALSNALTQQQGALCAQTNTCK